MLFKSFTKIKKAPSKIEKLYKKWQLPDSVKSYHREVGSRVLLLRDNWNGEDISKTEWEKIIWCAYLHNVGSFVIVNPSSLRPKEGMMQAILYTQHGSNPESVTYNMLKDSALEVEVFTAIPELNNFRETDDLLAMIIRYAMIGVDPVSVRTSDNGLYGSNTSKVPVNNFAMQRSLFENNSNHSRSTAMLIKAVASRARLVKFIESNLKSAL
jgi:hypothetical protein